MFTMDRYDNDLFKSLPLGYALRDYVEKGYPLGGFLTALVSNNLVESFGRADLGNRACMFEYTSWLYSYAPQDCWGSLDKIDKWLDHNGLEGLKAREETSSD